MFFGEKTPSVQRPFFGRMAVYWQNVRAYLVLVLSAFLSTVSKSVNIKRPRRKIFFSTLK